MKHFFTTILLFLTIFLKAQISMADSAIVVKQYLNVDDTNNYLITTNDIRIEGLDTVQNDYLKYAVTIKVLDLYQDEYTLHWHISNIENSNRQITRNPLSIMKEIDIYYTVDTDGKFVDFQKNNWTMVQFYTALEDAEDQNADKSSVLKVLNDLEKQYGNHDKINNLFEKEIKQFHYFYGLGTFKLDDEPKVYKTYLDNLFNTNPTPATTSYQLKEISNYLDNYVMVSSSIAEDEWLKESWFNYLEKTAKDMKVDAPDRSQIDSNIIYTVDTMNRIKNNGWISYSVQTKKVNFENTNFSQKRTIEVSR